LKAKHVTSLSFSTTLKISKFRPSPERSQLVSNNAIKAKGIITRDQLKNSLGVYILNGLIFPRFQIKKGRFISHFMVEKS
jgi:hypothetical protein